MRDDKNFSNPDSFIPTRWIGSEREQETCNKAAWIPFSYGPRNCIGKAYDPGPWWVWHIAWLWWSFEWYWLPLRWPLMWNLLKTGNRHLISKMLLWHWGVPFPLDSRLDSRINRRRLSKYIGTEVEASCMYWRKRSNFLFSPCRRCRLDHLSYPDTPANDNLARVVN